MSIFYKDQLEKFREILFHTLFYEKRGFKLTEDKLFRIFL